MNLALYPTLITPFTPDNKIDYASLGRLIDYLFSNHCDGLFAVCQSSEMFWLTDSEKIELARFCIGRSHAAGRKCVVSGHTQESIDDQIAYLRQLEPLGADALILVSNRLAAADEGDPTLIRNLEILLRQLDPGTRLGIYECPYPYNRLLSSEVIDYLVSTGRFDFIKDTSCQIELIRARLKRIAGSSIRLYNAHAALLLDSLKAGAAGYSSVMLNFIPELFSLTRRYLADETAPADLPPLQQNERSAREIGEFITMASAYEAQKYPLNAKHYLMRKGLLQTDRTRCLPDNVLSEAQQNQLLALANRSEKIRCKANLFSRRELIFPEGQHFPSCHASSLLALPDGTLLVAYFAGTAEGADDVGIWLSRQAGGHWQAPVCIAKIADVPHWNPVLFQAGRLIRLVFKIGSQIRHWQSYTMTSADNGLSWSAATPYGPENAAGGPVRSKPIRLSSGLLLAPNSDESEQGWQPRVDVSADDGVTFQRLAQVPINTACPHRENYMAGSGAIQPTLWESSPGHVHLLLRTTAGSIYRSDSADCGKTWCEAYNTHLPNNNSGIDIARHGQTLYLVMNPISGNWASRNPLVVRRSRDNGETFSHFLTLDCEETDPLLLTDAEYSYPAAVVAADCLHVSYTYLRRQIAYCRIELAAGCRQ